jgi:hypothetical protein
MTKFFSKSTSETFLSLFFHKKCNLPFPRPLRRTSKLQEKPSALKREHPAPSKDKID